MSRELRSTIRTVVRTTYQAQIMMLQVRARLVRLWIDRGEGAEGNTAAKKREYDKRIKAAVQEMEDILHGRSKVGEGIIKTQWEVGLVQLIKRSEQMYIESKKIVEEEVSKHPLWTTFFDNVVGLGPMLAAVIMSEIMIERAKYASSLWKYAGLDVVSNWELEYIRMGERVLSATERGELIGENDIPLREPLHGGVQGVFEENEEDPRRPRLYVDVGDYTVVYKMSKGRGRGRWKEHLVPKEITNAQGKVTKTMGLSFNPLLKTKLLGVVAVNFLKQKGFYSSYYYYYKTRMEIHPRYGVKNDNRYEVEGVDKPQSPRELQKLRKDQPGLRARLITCPARRHAMALRYMIKRFLVDLYKVWREQEGLEVYPPYEQAKLLREAGQSYLKK